MFPASGNARLDDRISCCHSKCLGRSRRGCLGEGRVIPENTDLWCLLQDSCRQFGETRSESKGRFCAPCK